MILRAGDPDLPESDVYVARQPIFDDRGEIFGYELLYRAGVEGSYQSDDGDQATISVISNSTFVFGVNTLAGAGRAFINFTRASLINDYARVLPPESVVIEILEDVEVDDEVIAACRRLKNGGYMLALDDFIVNGPTQALIGLADIVKVDFAVYGPFQRRRIAGMLLPRGVKLLAEKVETAADAQQAHDFGYSYVQGYFFAKPELNASIQAPGFKPDRLELLRELNRDEPRLDTVETLFRHDPALSYKLIRYLNTAAFGLRSPVTTVRQAVVYLGQAGLRTWATVLILADAGADHPFELIVTSVVRGRFCELVGMATGYSSRRHDLSLLGLFSLIDVILRRPMAEALDGVPLPPDVLLALRGQDSSLSPILNLARAYERADWDDVESIVYRLRLPSARVPQMYLEAVDWAEHTSGLR